ncbi:hypothetical protein ICN18_08260, partial [Polynucleobacter sp. Ross1-W9]|uniref:beta strand repeat-containing protein n=1 Tax=Polynucleobacter parvulilacunae TaxID=1855631 RepID=UPI001C0E4C25
GNSASATTDYNLQTTNLTWGSGGQAGTNANITAATVTLSATGNISKVYDGNANATVGLGNITITGLVAGDTLTLSNLSTAAYNNANVVNASSISTTNLTISTVGGNHTSTLSDYALQTTELNWGAGGQPGTSASITPANLTITANSALTQYGLGTNLTSTGYVTSGLVNNQSIGGVTLSSNGSVVTTNVGNYSITASNVTNNASFSTSNYNISYIDGNLQVTPANITVVADNQSRTYGGANPTTGTVTLNTGSTLYNGDTLGNATVTSAANASSNVGSYSLTASNQTLNTGSVGNYNITYAAGNLTINPANLTVTANSANLTYNGSQQSVTGFTGSGFVNNETIAVLTNVSAGGSGTNAGTYVTQANGTATNYNLNFVNGTLTIAKAALSVTGNGANTTYTGVTQNISGFNVSGLQGTDTVANLSSISATGANGTNAGIYINAVTVGTETNYVLTGTNGTLNIAKALVTVSADNQTRLYGQSNPTLTQSMTGFVNGETALTANVAGSSAASTTATNLTGVGNYTIASSVGNLSAANYNFTAANGTLTINKAHLTVTADDQSRVYGSANPTFTQTITGFVNGENSTTAAIAGSALGSNAANATTNVGNYSIAGNTGNLAAANYDFLAANGTLTITKAQLSALGYKVYDGSSAIVGSNLTVSGVNGETFAATGAATMTTKNVQANQTLSSLNGLSLSGVNGSSLGNYEILNTANTSVTVVPLNITIVAPNATKAYDGATIQLATASDLTALSAQLVGGDRVSSAAITYSDKNAGANKTVTLNSVVISDDNAGANYRVSVADATGGVITKANLTVGVVNDLKFVTQSDQAGYGGVIYNGFVAGETASVLTTGAITRTNAGVNLAGNYTGVLVASNWSASNYNINYQAGNYTIVPADVLAIKATNVTATYGTTPTYNLTAQYLHNGTIVTGLASSFNGTVSVIDGAGGAAYFNLSAINGSFSSSNNLQVGGYNLNASNLTIVGNNFNNLAVAGAITITPKSLNNNLGVQSITKVYDGSTSITAANLSFNQTLAGVLTNDAVGLIGSGSYADRNVGANKSVTLSMGLIGADARNYALTINTLTDNVGTITQLSCVTYIGGNTSGNWSSASNWAGGAIPDGNNVARVIIPTNASVVYNSDQVGITGSNISNSGNIIFASANPFNLTNNVSGGGVITQRGAGNLTISGNNSITGAVDIGAYNLTLASANAMGNATLVSAGGNLSFASGVAVSSLTTSGNVTLSNNANIANTFTANGYVTALGNINAGGNLIANNGISVTGSASVGGNVVVTGAANFASNVTTGGDMTVNGASIFGGIVNTTGNQTYNGDLTFLSSGTPSTANNSAISNFYSSAGNISFNGAISAGLDSAAAQRDLVISAANGTVLFNNQVGQNIASVQNGSTQYIPYANYSRASFSPYEMEVKAQNIQLNADVSTFGAQQYTGSVVIGGNGSNGNIRLLLSMDPSIIVKGDINGATAGQDSLVLAAVNLPGESVAPVISTGNIGLLVPLANVKTIQGQQNTNTTGNSNPLVADISFPTGQLNLNGSVNTIGNQTYTANNISLNGANTLTSQNGTIEMITGSNGSLGGLSNTTFALASGANLGSNLANLHPANIYHIPDPPPPAPPQVQNITPQITQSNLVETSQTKVTLLAQNNSGIAQYALNMNQAQQAIQYMKTTASDVAMSTGGVSVSMGDTVTRPGSSPMSDLGVKVDSSPVGGLPMSELLTKAGISAMGDGAAKVDGPSANEGTSKSGGASSSQGTKKGSNTLVSDASDISCTPSDSNSCSSK